LEACGAYVAITRRAGWWDGMDQMNENIMGAYKYMIQNPNIDAQQVYLCGTSAETHYFNKLVTATPGLWKGLIFVSPIVLPDFSDAPPFQTRPRILLTAGGKEHNEAWLKKYQLEALSHGIVADYAIYPEDGHVAVGNASVPARTKDIVHFIFEE
jgi:predicted esterase